MGEILIKKYEQSDKNSCWNKANADECLFILLDRDAAAAQTIRFWIDERIRLGLNQKGDEQTNKAEALADYMDLKHNQKLNP